MAPDERALREDLASIRFRIGASKGRWELKGIDFPNALFFIRAKPLPDNPLGFLLRAECTGYRATAPTSQLWHGELDAALPEANRPRIPAGLMECFSSWGSCLYHPIDRLGATHWPNDHMDLRWNSDSDIMSLLETVYGFLNRSDYVGASLPVEALKVPDRFMATGNL